MSSKCEHPKVLQVLLHGGVATYCCVAHSDSNGNSLPQCILCSDCGQYVDAGGQKEMLKNNRQSSFRRFMFGRMNKEIPNE